jgi:hypothetical protein
VGDFNVNILKYNNQAKNKKELLNFIDKIQLKSQFCDSTTQLGSPLKYIWENVFENECKYGVIKTYWLDFHKPILHSNYQTHFQTITKNH